MYSSFSSSVFDILKMFRISFEFEFLERINFLEPTKFFYEKIFKLREHVYENTKKKQTNTLIKIIYFLERDFLKSICFWISELELIWYNLKISTENAKYLWFGKMLQLTKRRSLRNLLRNSFRNSLRICFEIRFEIHLEFASKFVWKISHCTCSKLKKAGN